MNETDKDKINKLKNRYHKNNGQILVKYLDKIENEKKFALYRYDAQRSVPTDLAKITLGKRAAQEALNFEHVRNYSFSQHTAESKDEFICQINK